MNFIQQKQISCGQSFKWWVLAGALSLNFAPSRTHFEVKIYRWRKTHGPKWVREPGEFCKKIAACFLAKKNSVFAQARPYGQPGQKRGI